MAESLVIAVNIETRILTIRGQRVMLDADLAELYGVEIRALNQAVKRNAERFPDDFMFQLTAEEYDSLRSQFVTLKTGRGQHRKYLPYLPLGYVGAKKKRPIGFAPWKDNTPLRLVAVEANL